MCPHCGFEVRRYTVRAEAQDNDLSASPEDEPGLDISVQATPVNGKSRISNVASSAFAWVVLLAMVALSERVNRVQHTRDQIREYLRKKDASDPEGALRTWAEEHP